jgi:hypothetical protein
MQGIMIGPIQVFQSTCTRVLQKEEMFGLKLADFSRPAGELSAA